MLPVQVLPVQVLLEQRPLYQQPPWPQPVWQQPWLWMLTWLLAAWLQQLPKIVRSVA